MAVWTVLSVGQCGVGSAALRRLLRDRFDADVVPAPGSCEAVAELRRGHYDLVLVNRVFHHGGLGLELIAAIKADPLLQEIPVILVSDLPAAQRRAECLGAAPGFGKGVLDSPETTDRIAAALHDAASAAGG